MFTFVALSIVVIVGVACTLSIGIKLKTLTSKSCSVLIGGMRYVDMTEICCIAKGFSQGAMIPATDELVERLGGASGLERLCHNAGAMMDIARYLVLMKPEAYELAQLIRRDAAEVRRMTKVLSWQHRLQLHDFRFSLSARRLAQLYVKVSVDTMRLCECLVDEVLPLLQEISNVQASIVRAQVIAAEIGAG